MPSPNPKLMQVMPEMPKIEYHQGHKKHILVGMIALAALGFFWWRQSVLDDMSNNNQAPQEVKRGVEKRVQEEIRVIMNASGNQTASTTSQEQEKIQKEITTIMNAPGNKPAPQTTSQKQSVQADINRIMNAPLNQR